MCCFGMNATFGRICVKWIAVIHENSARMLSEAPVSHFRMPGVKNEPQFGIAFNSPLHPMPHSSLALRFL